jgi:hypothetical protein
LKRCTKEAVTCTKLMNKRAYHKAAKFSLPFPSLSPSLFFGYVRSQSPAIVSSPQEVCRSVFGRENRQKMKRISIDWINITHRPSFLLLFTSFHTSSQPNAK